MSPAGRPGSDAGGSRRSSLLRKALVTQKDSIMGAVADSNAGADGPSKLNRSFTHSECSSPLSRRSSGSFDFKRRGSACSDAFSKFTTIGKVDNEKLEEIIREVEKLKGK